MTESEFTAWASEGGLPDGLARQLVQHALTLEDIQAMDPDGDDEIVFLTYTLNDLPSMAAGEEIEGLGIFAQLDTKN